MQSPSGREPQASGGVLELVEVLDGPPEEVWPVVSDPEILREWRPDMSTHSQPASRGLRHAQPTRLVVRPTNRPRSIVMHLQLIHEALSRVRMRRPQAARHSEASRSARQIAMRALKEQDRMLSR